VSSKCEKSDFFDTNNSNILSTGPLHHLRHGGMLSSIILLASCTFGAGIVTLPYIAAKNGILLAGCLLLFGAAVSYFCSMILIKWTEKVHVERYEDFAQHAYGRRFSIFVAWWNIVTLMGFVISYIVFIKALIPHVLMITIGIENIPGISKYQSNTNQIISATLYTFIVLIPFSLFRNIGALRFNSLFGITWSMYIIFWVILLFFFSSELVESKVENIADARYFKISSTGLLNSVPFVVFSYMFQPAIPIIYIELENRSYKRMWKVVFSLTVLVTTFYFLMSTFGYLGVVHQPHMLKVLISQANILEMHYYSVFMKIATIALLFSLFMWVPGNILVAKNSVELLIDRKLSTTENIIITIGMWILWYLWGIMFPGISEVITLLGCTTNPLSGFIFPIIFYLKIVPDGSLPKKIISCLIFVFIVVISVLNFYLFWKYGSTL